MEIKLLLCYSNTASSLSFSSDLVRGMHARASGDARNEGARSFARLARFVRRTKKKRDCS